MEQLVVCAAIDSLNYIRSESSYINFLPSTVPGPARSAEIDFLTTGNLPQATNQTLVTIYEPGSTRDAVADPYTAPIGPSAGDFFNVTST